MSRAHSALTGMAIRLAECMGLHRDGTNYPLSPVEIHVRRMVWHQLCFLDLRTCESTGPRPQIHKDDFDTKYPLNVNDIDLEGPNPPTEDADYWTDMTFTRMRFECSDTQRYIWFQRPRLEKKLTTLTTVLSKVQKFIDESERKYVSMMDKTRPMHYMAFLIWKLLTLRMHIMILHRYGSNSVRVMPDRLRKILLSSGVQQVECAIMVETSPSLAPWAWYCGAIHQYHTTLLLLTELYAAPERYHQDRIWKCLDFVFELPDGIDRRQKSSLILTEVMKKSATYQQLRKVRAPKVLEERLVKGTYTGPDPVTVAAAIAAVEAIPRSDSVSPLISPPVSCASELQQQQQAAQQHQHQQQQQQNQQHHQTQQHQQNPQLQHQQHPQQHQQQFQPNAHINTNNVMPSNGVTEFRNFTPHGQVSDVYYSQGNPMTMPRQTSPHSSDTGSMVAAAASDTGFKSGSPNDMMLDIDWVSRILEELC